MTIHSGIPKSGPWLLEASTHFAAGRLRLPDVPSRGLDALGITQRKLNGNFMSWMDELSDRDKEEGGLWYPTGNDWGHHASDLHGVHPDKVFGVMSKTSPQRAWYDNLADTHNIAGNYGHNPGGILKPGGISGTDNLKQSLRVMGAPDDPEAIHQAFLGTKNVGGKPVPRTAKDLPKTYDFMRTLRDPEEGGAGNYLHQPGVADSWMSRSMLWSKKRWDDAQNGGKPLTWPGKGTGQGLDKHLPVKKPNPVTGQWEVVGSKPPSARDVAARITGMGGGYDRMRNAMRYGAAAHGMPFTHGAQAAVWKSISGNQNPSGVPNHDIDPGSIEHPGERWDEMWNRRASGLHVPAQHGLTARVAAHGNPFEVEDTLDEGWGTAKDIGDILRHIAMAPPGWDHWEDRPGLTSLDLPGEQPPLQQHEQQRMGPHPEHEASRWYTAAGQDEVGDQDKYKQQAPGPTEGGSSGGYGSGNSSWSGGTDPHATPAPGVHMPSMPSGGGSSMPSSMPGSGSSGGSSAPVSYTPSSGVEQWRTQVDTGLQRNGLPTSLDSQVLHQMETESSGNPNAINNWDSNAQAGHPSQGLMQTIPSTFNTYHLPGDSMSITDPQANIDSAIGYAKSTYGPGLTNSQGNGMGSGHGYDEGGWLPPGEHTVWNNTGEPELITPPGGFPDGKIPPKSDTGIHSAPPKSGAYLLSASQPADTFGEPFEPDERDLPLRNETPWDRPIDPRIEMSLMDHLGLGVEDLPGSEPPRTRDFSQKFEPEERDLPIRRHNRKWFRADHDDIYSDVDSTGAGVDPGELTEGERDKLRQSASRRWLL